ncbi:quinoprotein relay system zinc metallohydrolase 1 [Spectribacter hydrogenoxidans]|uniref:Quinoprotein relay system zinc metallohydrolase 1 n=1 Tax=Spectribacter hydrogenoxidans TaxID=3075608 RepID=A0ABU3BXF5_9GAMM|nr:quinoprotein relay system zinc metallohydrolase 1 [Salinisphaera sp. W335]MDT0633814.1 quinoprotein relay system zinc metallohydrolase 1 [Salinisphaera sp. W335]
MTRWLWLIAALTSPLAAAANPYDLTPQRVAENTYVFVGALEHFSYDNLGNIVNTGFIVTDEGVVVIDTGPSRLYGEAMRVAIAGVTDQPVVQVYITHHHPDHYLGNQAFADVDVGALAGTIKQIRDIGGDLTTNMYNLVGGAMRGTESLPPTQEVTGGSRVTFGRHELELIGMQGHTGADLAILDHRTGVLFAGDLAFLNRTPTTPNADVATWVEGLHTLGQREFETLVPGHGPVRDDAEAIAQTQAYLSWLWRNLNAAARHGLDMPEIMMQELPYRWRGLAVITPEFRRSVSHLYPDIEAGVLEPVESP